MQRARDIDWSDYRGIRTIGVTAGACFLGSWALSLGVTMPERDGFNIVEWELRHVPGKWLYQAGRLFSDELSRAEKTERLAGFLLLSARVEELPHAVTLAAHLGSADVIEGSGVHDVVGRGVAEVQGVAVRRTTAARDMTFCRAVARLTGDPQFGSLGRGCVPAVE